MQTIGEILDFLRQNDANISKISKETGIPADRLYSWRAKRGTPKSEDSIKLLEWAKKREKNAETPAEMQEVAKSDEMTSMFLTLIDHLQVMSASLVEIRQLERENNSLVKSILLNQAKSLPSDENEGAERRFQASLEAAKEILRRNFLHTSISKS